MRSALVFVLLFAFGCAELRYSSRTAMVEVAPDPTVAPITPAENAARARGKSDRGRGLLIGGGIASLIGVAFIIGGAVGLHAQSAANDAADAQCMAQHGGFCGLLDGLSYAPYGALIGVGTVATLSGIVLIGIGANRHDRQ